MAIKTTGNLIPATTDTPLDARSRVAALADILNIENPALGALVYCLEDGRYYRITALKDKQIGALLVPDAAVAEYEEFKSGTESTDCTRFEVYANDTEISVGTVDAVSGLAYAVAVPPGMTHAFNIRSDHRQPAIDVTVDWGDGETTALADLPTEAVDLHEYDSVGEVTYHLEHTYASPARYMVTVTGCNYWGLSCWSGHDSLLSRVFAPDLPLAGCVSNLVGFCRGALRLQQVLIPTGMDLFATVNNASGLFEKCLNLLSATNLKTKFRYARYVSAMFRGDVNMHTCDFILPENCVKSNGMRSVWEDCRTLTADIAAMMPERGFVAHSVDLSRVCFGCESLTGTVPAAVLWDDPTREWIAVDAFTGAAPDIQAQVPASWGGTDIEPMVSSLPALVNSHSLELGYGNEPKMTADVDDHGKPTGLNTRAFQCIVIGQENRYGDCVLIRGDSNENQEGHVEIHGNHNKTYQFQFIRGSLNELTATVNARIWGNTNKDLGKNANGSVVFDDMNIVTARNTFNVAYRTANHAKGSKVFGRYLNIPDSPENYYAFILGDGHLGPGNVPEGDISFVHRVFKKVTNPLYDPSQDPEQTGVDAAGETRYVRERSFSTEYRGHLLAVTQIVSDTGTITLDHDQYARWDLTGAGAISLQLANWVDGDTGEIIIDTTSQSVSIPADWITLGADITTKPGLYVLEVSKVRDAIYYGIKCPNQSGGGTSAEEAAASAALASAKAGDAAASAAAAADSALQASTGAQYVKTELHKATTETIPALQAEITALRDDARQASHVAAVQAVQATNAATEAAQTTAAALQAEMTALRDDAQQASQTAADKAEQAATAANQAAQTTAAALRQELSEHSFSASSSASAAKASETAAGTSETNARASESAAAASAEAAGTSETNAKASEAAAAASAAQAKTSETAAATSAADLDAAVSAASASAEAAGTSETNAAASAVTAGEHSSSASSSASAAKASETAAGTSETNARASESAAAASAEAAGTSETNAKASESAAAASAAQADRCHAIGVVCTEAPPSLFDGLIWISGGSATPEWITGALSPAIVQDQTIDPSTAENFTIIIGA